MFAFGSVNWARPTIHTLLHMPYMILRSRADQPPPRAPMQALEDFVGNFSRKITGKLGFLWNRGMCKSRQSTLNIAKLGRNCPHDRQVGNFVPANAQASSLDSTGLWGNDRCIMRTRSAKWVCSRFAFLRRLRLTLR